MEVTPRVQHWAIISPDAQHTVAYFKSTWATAAAANLRCGQHLALVEPPTNKYDNTFIAYFVQSVRHPLPATYVPIMPCRLGPREPLALDFEWPFGECVVDTSQKLIFDPVPSTTDVSTRKTISKDSSRMFCVTTTTDRKEQAQMKSLEYRARRKAERDAAGFPDDDSRWTTFSLKSTVAEVRPNQFFSPWSISAQIDYNIGSFGGLLPSSQCLDEVKSVERLRAHFSRQGTDRTIIWTIDQASGAAMRPAEHNISDFEHSALWEFSMTFERPRSPYRNDASVVADTTEDTEDDHDERWGGRGYGIYHALPRPPVFEPQSLQMIYFDVYWTLIDSESGIFSALGPLLARSSYCFGRSEALSMYFEVEGELKAHLPTTPYLEILSQTHQALALRLGLTSSADESSAFASSLFTWPLFPDALQSLRALHASVPFLVAVADMDLETLYKTRAFPVLSPYFAEIWSWDLCHAYRPDQYTFSPAVAYHDNMGVPRAQCCLISNALSDRLDFGCKLLVPAVWLRDPAALAGGVPAADGSFVWKVVPDLPSLVSVIMTGKHRSINEEPCLRQQS